MRQRKTVLFMPGDSLRKIEKATQSEVDSIVMDLEDGVAFNQKEAARQVTAEALRTLFFGRREKLVRLNPPEEGRDITVTFPAHPDGYVIPKAETAAQVVAIDQLLAEAEAAHGLPIGSTALLAIIETALGVMNLKEIATASQRLQALIFGAEDLASSIGAIRTPESWEVFYGRSAVVTAAAAYQLEAIDMVYFDLHNLTGLEAECRLARQLGYGGKCAIHPRQVEVINRAFAPTESEIAQAQRLLQAFAEHQAAGSGAFAFDGKMVDRPVIRAAEKVLARVFPTTLPQRP
jgi:citrate lyase beta subunit